MAILLDDAKIEDGYLTRVWNTEKAALSNADDFYWYTKIQPFWQDDEIKLMFTQEQIEDIFNRADKGVCDLAIGVGEICRVFGKLVVYLIDNCSGEEFLTYIRPSEFEVAKERAENNPEDIPKDSPWWTNLNPFK